MLTALLSGLAYYQELAQRRDPMYWKFWICAFANNQYRIDHAVGSDVWSSSFAQALESDSCKYVAAVLDKKGRIYTRIWCAFELFYTSQILQVEGNRDIGISLVNPAGNLTEGSANTEDTILMVDLIDNVHTEDASASNQADKDNIYASMAEHHVDPSDLNATLRMLATTGAEAALIRNFSPLVFGIV